MREPKNARDDDDNLAIIEWRTRRHDVTIDRNICRSDAGARTCEELERVGGALPAGDALGAGLVEDRPGEGVQRLRARDPADQVTPLQGG